MFRTFLTFARFSHSLEPLVEAYYSQRTVEFEKIKSMNDQHYHGAYTQMGYQRFKQKNSKISMKPLLSNRSIGISDVGIGTYKGSLNCQDDILQFNSIIDSVMLGSNVIDTCRNFRGGRSQQAIKSAVKYLIETKKYNRDELFIMSKCGYVRQELPLSIQAEVINDHCVHPTYLEQSLSRSLSSMGISTLDVFYLNNFAECQLAQLGKQKFQNKLCQVFEFMEKCIQENKIKSYGLASWNSFRVSPKDPFHLNLHSILKLAQKVGGSNHGFKFLQIPINIMMPEAFAQKNQEFGSLLQTAQKLNMNVISCSPLLNGTLINIPLPSNKLNCRNNGSKHLQIIRSIPTQALVCTLIGQKRTRHVKKNLEVLQVDKLKQWEWFQFFIPKPEPNEIGQY